MSPEMLGVVMVGVMLFAIFIGFPISFTLIFLGFTFGVIADGGPKLVSLLTTLKFNETIMENTLAAVPMFVFMGIMMEQANLMERLFSAVQLLLARVRGSLYYAVLFVSTIFAAATGIVGASVTILGIMAAKTMNRSNYDVRLAAGTITAGGTLGILIPPSIMLVVMGPVLEVPVTELFAAAIIPGIMLAVLYAGYTTLRCWMNPELGPPMAEEDIPENGDVIVPELLKSLGILVASIVLIWALFKVGIFAGPWGQLASIVIGIAPIIIYGFITPSYVVREFLLGLVPPAALVGVALGSILAGWANPTEAAGFGGAGALLLTIVYGRFTFKKFYEALIKTLEISVLILFLVAASNFFGAVLARLGTPTMMTELLLGLDLAPWMLILIVLGFIFLLGWPLEWVPIVLIIIPILLPLIESLQILDDPQQQLIWFGILVAVCLQTAWLSPPVALSAYFLKGVVPEWDLRDIYIGMMQFMVIQLIGLALVFFFPAIALWLPSFWYG